jgi:hypothetical protein
MRHYPAFYLLKWIKVAAVLLLTLSLTGCDDPQVYGSVGVSSGYSSYGGYGRYGSGQRMHGSIRIGGRIR